MLVGIIVARPVCEDGLERSEVAPDRNRLEVFVRGIVENSRKLLAGEDGNGFIERNRGYFAEAPDVRCYVANRLFSRLAYAIGFSRRGAERQSLQRTSNFRSLLSLIQTALKF